MQSWQDIISFWFEEIEPQKWWQKSTDFDELLSKRYSGLLLRAKAGELSDWRTTALGSLAEILVLDQFSRNIFRDTADAFAADNLALCLAQWAISVGADKQLSQQQRQFLYMPFMHSESLAIHKQAVELYGQMDKAYGYNFELKHKVIIEQFGRYPHRNKILGRKSSSEELAFLKEPNSSF